MFAQTLCWRPCGPGPGHRTRHILALRSKSKARRRRVTRGTLIGRPVSVEDTHARRRMLGRRARRIRQDGTNMRCLSPGPCAWFCLAGRATQHGQSSDRCPPRRRSRSLCHGPRGLSAQPLLPEEVVAEDYPRWWPNGRDTLGRRREVRAR